MRLIEHIQEVAPMGISQNYLIHQIGRNCTGDRQTLVDEITELFLKTAVRGFELQYRKLRSGEIQAKKEKQTDQQQKGTKQKQISSLEFILLFNGIQMQAVHLK
jgi:hypothetical protein